MFLFILSADARALLLQIHVRVYECVMVFYVRAYVRARACVRVTHRVVYMT